MLNRDEIKARAIILDPSEDSYRPASYDVRIGTILAVQSQAPLYLAEGDSYTVPPQGMVEVVSAESIRLPANLAGYASVKTGLSRQGLLALNTGILDPGYEGPVSATVVNFGKTEAHLAKGEPFLRLTFHEYNVPAEFKPPDPEKPEDFLRKRRKEVCLYFSPLFLNLDDNASAALRAAVRKNIAWIAVVFSIFTFFVTITTFFVSYEQKQFLTKDRLRAELGAYFREEEFSRFDRRLDKVEKELQLPNQGASGGAPKPSVGGPGPGAGRAVPEETK